GRRPVRLEGTRPGRWRPPERLQFRSFERLQRSPERLALRDWVTGRASLSVTGRASLSVTGSASLSGERASAASAEQDFAALAACDERFLAKVPAVEEEQPHFRRLGRQPDDHIQMIRISRLRAIPFGGD